MNRGRGAARSRTRLRPGSWPPTWSSAAGRRWSCFRCTGWHHLLQAAHPGQQRARLPAVRRLPAVPGRLALHPWTSGATPCGRTSTPWWSPSAARCWPCCWAQPVPTRSSASPTSRASGMIGLVAGCLALVAVAVGLGMPAAPARAAAGDQGPGPSAAGFGGPCPTGRSFWIISQRDPAAGRGGDPDLRASSSSGCWTPGRRWSSPTRPPTCRSSSG